MIVALIYAGGASGAAWGAAHLVPTAKVVAGFGPISDDNRRILTMEWISEGLFLIFVGVVVILVTAVDHRAHAARVAYLGSVAALAVMAVVSLFTGFRVRFLPFRFCPVIFAVSAALVLAGTFA